MRGKHGSNKNCRCLVGITPADAGKTLATSAVKNYAKDHPRGCGENVQKVFPIFPISGSPPRMRGKQSIGFAFVFFCGITPADAGKTGKSCCSYRRYEDHPRGCGENYCSSCFGVWRLGSPPRMRGKLSIPSLSNDDNRITPADAGKT